MNNRDNDVLPFKRDVALEGYVRRHLDYLRVRNSEQLRRDLNVPALLQRQAG